MNSLRLFALSTFVALAGCSSDGDGDGDDRTPLSDAGTNTGGNGGGGGGGAVRSICQFQTQWDSDPFPACIEYIGSLYTPSYAPSHCQALGGTWSATGSCAAEGSRGVCVRGEGGVHEHHARYYPEDPSLEQQRCNEGVFKPD